MASREILESNNLPLSCHLRCRISDGNVRTVMKDGMAVDVSRSTKFHLRDIIFEKLLDGSTIDNEWCEIRFQDGSPCGLRKIRRDEGFAMMKSFNI